MRKIIYTLILFIFFIPHTFALEENVVNIYFFHSQTCNHCKQELQLLETLEKEYSNVKIYKYEVSIEDNNNLLSRVKELLEINSTGVPVTIIADEYFLGYSSSNTKKTLVGAIEYFSKYEYTDIIGEYIINTKIVEDYDKIDLPKYGMVKDITLDEYIKENDIHKIKLISSIDISYLPLTLLPIFIGIIEGFISQIYLLPLFLLLLMSLEDTKKRLIYTICFIFFSTITHFLLINDLIVIPYLRQICTICAIINFILVCSKIINIRLNINLLEKKCLNKNIKTVIYIILFSILIILIKQNNLISLININNTYNRIIYLSNITTLEQISYQITYISFFILISSIICILMSYIFKKIIKNNLSKKILSSIIFLIIGIILIF